MSKVREKARARKYRKGGKSIKSIARLLGVSTSSVSIWCEDIRLTDKQINTLDAARHSLRMRGLLKGAHMNRDKKLARIAFYREEGKVLIKTIDKRDLLLAG